MEDWFGLSPFRSPLLRGSLLVSFPPPTKMFPFGGFPPGTPPAGFPGAGGYSPPAGGPIRGSRVQRLHAPTPGISPLAAPFLGARAEPSTGRRPRRENPPGRGPSGPGLAGSGGPPPDPYSSPETLWATGPLQPQEVIQPQVPLRLPCYDFSPLAGEGFDPTTGCPEAGPHPSPARVERRAVCARSRDVFTARC